MKVNPWIQLLDQEVLPFHYNYYFNVAHLVFECHDAKHEANNVASWWKDSLPHHFNIKFPPISQHLEVSSIYFELTPLVESDHVTLNTIMHVPLRFG